MRLMTQKQKKTTTKKKKKINMRKMTISMMTEKKIVRMLRKRNLRELMMLMMMSKKKVRTMQTRKMMTTLMPQWKAACFCRCSKQRTRSNRAAANIAAWLHKFLIAFLHQGAVLAFEAGFLRFPTASK